MKHSESNRCQRDVIVSGGAVDRHHRANKDEQGPCQTGEWNAESTAVSDHHARQGNQKTEMHQCGRRLPAERIREQVQYFDTLGDVRVNVPGHPMETVEPQVSGGIHKVISRAVGTHFRSHGVDGVNGSVDGKRNATDGQPNTWYWGRLSFTATAKNVLPRGPEQDGRSKTQEHALVNDVHRAEKKNDPAQARSAGDEGK